MFALFRRRASESPSAVAQADRARDDWTSQPVLQRTSGDLELTAPTAQFVPGLTGRRRLDLALAPLGHEVRLEAPAGIATGIARAVETAPGRPPADVR